MTRGTDRGGRVVGGGGGSRNSLCGRQKRRPQTNEGKARRRRELAGKGGKKQPPGLLTFLATKPRDATRPPTAFERGSVRWHRSAHGPRHAPSHQFACAAQQPNARPQFTPLSLTSPPSPTSQNTAPAPKANVHWLPLLLSFFGWLMHPIRPPTEASSRNWKGTEPTPLLYPTLLTDWTILSRRPSDFPLGYWMRR